MIHRTVSWIADELIGIRTLEQRLSGRLESRARQNSQSLLRGIDHLNQRMDVLDEALDKYMYTGKVA